MTEEDKLIEKTFVMLIYNSIVETGEIEAGIIRFDEKINSTLADTEQFCYIKSPSFEGENGAPTSATLVVRTRKEGSTVSVVEVVGMFVGDIGNRDAAFLDIQGEGLLDMANELAGEGAFDSFHA